MKKIYITVITLVTIFCIIGGTIFRFGLFGIPRLFFDEGEYGSYYDTVNLSSFENIKVEADIMEVKIYTGSSFSLEYSASKKSLVPSYEIKGDTITIKQKQKVRNGVFGINTNNCVLTLTVPEGTKLKAIDISTNVGNAEINRISAQSINIDSDVGDCTILECKFERTELESNVGDINAKNSELGTVTGSSDVGDVSIINCGFGDLDIESDVGDVDIVSSDSLENYDINLNSDIGEVHFNNNGYKKNFTQSGNSGYKVKVTTDVGSISLEY